MADAGKTSARGTPHTLHPTVGAGTPPNPAAGGQVPATEELVKKDGVVYNPGFLEKLDARALNGHPMVKHLACKTVRVLLREQVASLMGVMGLEPADLVAILRELADELGRVD